MDEKNKPAEKDKPAGTKVKITYTLDPSKLPNQCEAQATCAGQAVTAYGASWAEAKQNAIGLCKQILALGEVPKAEDVDLG